MALKVEEQGLCSAPEDRKGEAGVAKFGDQQDFPYIMQLAIFFPYVNFDAVFCRTCPANYDAAWGYGKA